MAIDSVNGRRIADYRLESVLGRGGQGVVYLAEHVHLGRKVALKLLAPEMAADAEFRARFVSESRIAASLDHPNILAVYDGGESDGELYVAVRLVGGSDLATILEEQGHMAPARALDVVGPVAAALDFAHAHGLVHRDVKPGNVLIEPPTAERDHEEIFLADFGLTKRVRVDEPDAGRAGARTDAGAPAAAIAAGPDAAQARAPVTQAGMFLGTPEFAAPEQVRGEPLTGAADQYALACVLFQCLTGELPFERDTVELVLIAHAMEPPPSLRSRRPELPERLDEVVARGMAKDPAARYPSCTAFVRAAREVLRKAPKVFVSYARGDKPFVERLHAGLADRGRDTWVDWTGIAPSAVWMAEIRQAIDRAAAFVFVISPDSAESGSCREELAHAEAANKRIVPVVYRDVEPSLLPPALAARNWIFLRSGDDRDEGLAKILEAIDLDPEWVEAHTRLLTRAREWEAGGRKASLALRGGQLKDAEEWLASARGREPPPAQLHTEYVLASRRQAGRRQRSGFAVVTAALLVMALLAGLAFAQRQAANHQRNVARQQRAEAVRQARLALSRQLTAQALPLLGSKIDTGLLLALQAYRTAHTNQARDALLAGVQDSAHLVRFLRRPAPGLLRTMAFSPNGRTIAVGAGDVVLWDVASGRVVGRPIPGDTAAFSPDGATLAVGSSRGPVTLWDVAKRREAGSLGPASAAAGSEAFSPDGKALAVGSSKGAPQGRARIALFDVASGNQIGSALVGHPLPGPAGGVPNGVFDVEFSPNGKLLVAGSMLDVELFDVATHRVVAVALAGRGGQASFTVQGAFHRGTFSPDGRLLAVAGSGNSVKLWDVARNRQAGRPLTGHTATVTSLAFAPDGGSLAAGAADNSVIRWDLQHGQQVGQPLVGHTSAVTGLAFSADGSTLVSGEINGTVILWNVGPRQPVVQSVVAFNPVIGLAFSPDGTTLAQSGLPITLRDPTTGRVTGTLPAEGPPPGFAQSLAFSPDGKTLAAGTQAASGGGPPAGPGPSGSPPTGSSPTGSPPTGSPPTGSPPTGSPPTGSSNPRHRAVPSTSIVLWDVATGRIEGSPLPLSSRAPVTGVAFSRDGKTLASQTTDGSVAVFDVATGRRTHQFHASGGSVAFSPDGATLAFGGTGLTLVDVATGRISVVPLGSDVTGAAYSPDGRTVAAGKSDGSVALVDASSHRQVGAPLLGPAATIIGLAFSPDGSLLAGSSSDGTIFTWTVRTHQPIGAPLRPSVAPVTAVAFSPDGSTLASSSIDGTVALWNGILFRFDAAAVESRLCGVVGRNLTQSEWNEFLPGQPYRRTCREWPPRP